MALLPSCVLIHFKAKIMHLLGVFCNKKLRHVSSRTRYEHRLLFAQIWRAQHSTYHQHTEQDHSLAFSRDTPFIRTSTV